MENVIKALIISAVVLLAIMIISFGMFIYESSNSTVTENKTLDQLELKTHNSKYELLKGIQTGTKVKILLEYAIQDNEKFGNSKRDYDSRYFTVNIRSNDEDILKSFKGNSKFVESLTTREYGVRYEENIRKISDAIRNSRKYRIWYSYTSTGYIWEIHIDSVN